MTRGTRAATTTGPHGSAGLARLVEGLSVALYACDAEGRITYFNAAAARLWGRAPTLGKDRWCGSWRICGIDGSHIPHETCPMALALQEGHAFRDVEARLLREDGSSVVVSVNVDPLFDEQGVVVGAVNVLFDISGRKESEQALTDSEQSLRFLSQASGALARSIDYQATLRTVAELVVPRLAEACCVEVLDADGALQVAASSHEGPGATALPGGLTLPHGARDEAAASRVVKTGRAELHREDPQRGVDGQEPEGARSGRSAQCAMIVPLRARGRVFGALTLVSGGSRGYDERDLALVEDLASRCAAAIDNATLYAEAQREIKLRSAVERQLRRSRERLRFALDAAGAVNWELDIATKRLRRSDNRVEVYGHPRDVFDGTLDGFLRQVHPQDRASVLQRMEHAIATGEPYHAEFRLDTGEDPPRWLEAKGQVVFDGSGMPVRMVGISTNVSERKQAELELHRREEEFRVLVEHSPDIVARFDRELRHLYVNPAIVEVAGVQPAELIGRTSRELGMPPAICDQWEQVIRTVFEQGTQQSLEYSHPTPGGMRHYYSRVVPELSAEGRVSTVLGVTRDITHRRLAEEQVRSMNEKLEQRVAERTAQLRRLTRQLALAEQQERRRLSHLLHDGLQQLLVAASMRIGLLDRRLGEGEASAVAREVRELILQSIDLSRSLTQELSPPVLHDGGLAAALPWLAGLMEQRHGLQVSVDLGAGAEAHDEETRVVLFSAARELLFNVVKHAHTAEAVLSLHCEDSGLLRLTVEDRGAGFEPREQRGNEFGLFGLRERVQYLGGRLVVTSERGGGTRVDLEIPSRGPVAAESRVTADVAAREHPAPVGVVRPLQPREITRVLLADDHQILRDGVASILAELPDLEVVGEAADGLEAVELALEVQPDVVIMDITMPRLSGIEATRLIRARLPEVVVVGLSMHNSPDVAREMTDAGAVEVLVKDGPVDALLEAIRRAHRDRGAQTGDPGSSEAASAPSSAVAGDEAESTPG